MKNLPKITPKKILIFFVLLNLVIGLFIVQDFGRSTDESHEWRSYVVANSIYTGEINENPIEKYAELGVDQYYGTASTTVITFFQDLFFPNTDHNTKVVAHYLYFIFFQIAVIGIFLLAQFFFDDWISLSVAIIFGTQPLLFGHGFINPKDIIILATFLFTVITGFSMVDKWQKDKHPEASPTNTPIPAGTKKRKRNKKILVAVIFSFLLLLLWSSPWITNGLLQLVEYSFNTKGQSFFGKLFASKTTFGSLEGYLLLLRISILGVYRWICFGTPLLLILLFYYAQKHNLFGKKINLFLLLAAAIWGYAISTRIVSFTAGGIVGIYALLNFKKKAVFPLIVYTLTASIISYITWPFSWIHGLSGYLKSLTVFRDFPWPGFVLFEGIKYDPTELPARFLPKMMALQFTEPMVILTLAGLIISLYLLLKKNTHSQKLVLLFAWFSLPQIYAIIVQPTVYNNFRHFLFVLPPLFIFAGFALQPIASRLKQKYMIFAICLLLTIPGLVCIVKIHPYQYIYYNSFAGGVEGANNQYELDYWATAYKDAMDYVNGNFPSGSRILIWKNNLFGEVYAEYSYYFAPHTTVPEYEYQTFDYMIIPTNALEGQEFFEDLPVVFSVDVDNVSLMLILKIPDSP